MLFKIDIIKILVRILIPIIALMFVGAITYVQTPKNYTKSIKKFTVRAGRTNFLIGAIGTIFFGFVFTMVLRECLMEDNSTGVVIAIISLCVLVIPTFLMMISPIPRFWDVDINGNDIKIIKLFVFVKNFKVSDIDYCIVGKGDAKVYVKGKSKKAFYVDAMHNGIHNFLKRMEEEGVPLYEKIEGHMIPVKRGPRGKMVFVEEGLTNEQRQSIQRIEPRKINARFESDLIRKHY